MPKLPDVIRDYVLAHNIDPSAWTVADTGQVILIGDIPHRTQADKLHEYLTARGYLVTVTMGDRHGTTWTLSARPFQAGQAPVDQEQQRLAE